MHRDYMCPGLHEFRPICERRETAESLNDWTTASLSQLLEYTADIVNYNKALRGEVSYLNSLIIDVVRDKDPKRDGLFRYGKRLCEGESCVKDEKQGLEFIRTAASGKNESALQYLIDYYSSQGDWKRVVEFRRALYDMGDKLQLVDFLVEHPDMYDLSWCKEIVNSMIRCGYLATNDDRVSLESKIALVDMCIQRDRNVVSVIAENLPDDDELLARMKVFFKSLQSSRTRNDNVRYFIGYNYLFGVTCDRDTLKGTDIMRSLRGRVNRKLTECVWDITTQELEDLLAMDIPSELTFKIIILGKHLCGKTSLMCEITGHPYYFNTFLTWQIMKVNRGGKNITLHFGDTDCTEDFYSLFTRDVRDSLGAVICYDASDHNSIDYWYKYVMESCSFQPMPILVVQTKCDLHDSDALNNVDMVKRYCRERSISHISTSATEHVGIENFLDAVCDLGIIGYKMLHRPSHPVRLSKK